MASFGAAGMGLSLGLTGAIGRLWVGYLTYGIGVGISAACVYIPTLAIVGGWFMRRRATALGVAAAGTGCGTLVAPPVIATFIAQYGWRLSYVIIGATCALLLIGCAVVVEMPPLRNTETSRSLRHVIFSFPFAMLYLSWLLATTALFVPFVYLPAFALKGGASELAASTLVSLIGGMSILGRAGIGGLGDRIGMTRLLKISVLVMGISYLLWLGSPSFMGLILFAVVLGLAYGIRIALMPGVLIEFFGLSNLGTILGAFFTATGIAAVVGPLLVGAIVDHSGSFQWGIAFALMTGLFGFLVLIPLRPNISKENGRTQT
jgi:MFS family permease